MGEVWKKGFVRGVQRYRFNGYGLNFVEGDRRLKTQKSVKKALCVILYSLGKASFSMLGKTSATRLRLFIARLRRPRKQRKSLRFLIKEIAFDEMWHFLQKKSKVLGHQGEGFPGWQGGVMAATFKRLDDKRPPRETKFFYDILWMFVGETGLHAPRGKRRAKGLERSPCRGPTQKPIEI